MSLKFNNLDLTYRKLKISDFKEFKQLFYSCFKKKISFKFYRWRYFNNNFSFCYGVFKSSKLISNVGMVSAKLNNIKRERIFSRHSSMVLKKYRGKGIFSNLLKIVKKKIEKNSKLIVMWPNKNNFSNFGIDKKKVFSKKYYLYKTLTKSNLAKKTKNHHIEDLIKFRSSIKNSKSFFFKDYVFLNKKYLMYQKKDYIINEFKNKNLKSYFILKNYQKKLGSKYVILDHFGSQKILSNHLSCLISDYGKIIFLSKKKLNKPNFELLNIMNFKIGFIKRYGPKEKKWILNNKEIFLGDTDIFMTLGNK